MLIVGCEGKRYANIVKVFKKREIGDNEISKNEIVNADYISNIICRNLECRGIESHLVSVNIENERSLFHYRKFKNLINIEDDFSIIS